MLKIFYASFSRLSVKEQLVRELRAAKEERLHATHQREYWLAMEGMLLERTRRLEDELEEESKNAA